VFKGEWIQYVRFERLRRRNADYLTICQSREAFRSLVFPLWDFPTLHKAFLVRSYIVAMGSFGTSVAQNKDHLQRIAGVSDFTIVVRIAFPPLITPSLQQPKWRKHKVDAETCLDFVRGASFCTWAVKSVFLKHSHVGRAPGI